MGTLGTVTSHLQHPPEIFADDAEKGHLKGRDSHHRDAHPSTSRPYSATPGRGTPSFEDRIGAVALMVRLVVQQIRRIAAPLVLLLCASGCGGQDRETTSNSRAVSPSVLAESDCRIEWQKLEMPSVLEPGQTVTALVAFRNAGDRTWPDAQMSDPVTLSSRYAVRLSYRWWDGTGGNIVRDYQARSDVPFPIVPGQSVTLPIDVSAPAESGTYRLQFDLVYELLGWCESVGARRFVVPVFVRAI